MFDSPPQSPDRPLLTTTTGEPYQPVRLSYSVPSKGFVTNVFCRLRCMEEDRDGGRWGWFHRAEAESLTFANPPVKPPVEMEPVLLGVFRFPKSGGMTLQVRSFSRAIEAARFFGPILGPKVVARRARVINRLFDGNELTDGLDALDRHLDRNVTVIDPRETEERMARYMAGAKTAEERRQAYERYHEDKRRERRDVPLVEDFPLAPEEETADFMHLTTTLRLREIRAYEHWIGNTHVNELVDDAIEPVDVLRKMPLEKMIRRGREQKCPGEGLEHDSIHAELLQKGDVNGELGNELPGMCAMRWEDLREVLYSLEDQSSAILRDIAAALDAWGYRRKTWFSSLSGATTRLRADEAMAVFQGWRVR